MDNEVGHEKTARGEAHNASDILWSKPRPQNVPAPTYAPAVVALAIVCLLWGLITTYLISLLGLVLLGIGLADWIGG